ncbi:amidohydrolase family protein [Aromatoleum toluclasticum]|uniref:amidohydrolase family protein n=1 Tax=Aromatoleum toluclasticum TaxID=92003 RepID=UPI001D19585A|nr:amidohydrolase family protein [Aromatoleum toluclasticum]MCC4117527.1 amidohydrolase family protein [Aromatoleum toluclasticum]
MNPSPHLLIRDAELQCGTRVDVRLTDGRIARIGPGLRPRDDEAVIDARGRALSVGLHDHHVHLMAHAAALESLSCSDLVPSSAGDFADLLLVRARREDPTAPGWIRCIGYHESIAGLIDRNWLDSVGPDVPVRIQHRSGRLWILNTCALRRLGMDEIDTESTRAAPLERIDGRLTGRLFDGDEWLRARLAGTYPSLARTSEALARLGVTGVTDAGARNGRSEFAHFVAERRGGRLKQDVLVMGSAELDDLADEPGIRVGPTKLYLRDAELPSFEEFCHAISRSHAVGRPVAIHCVTRGELIFATAALRQCGTMPGDRIEHASVAPPEALELLRELKLTVVTQPNFVFERGDSYLNEVDREDLPWLYRGRGFARAGVPLAAGTDAPCGDLNPWAAMAAAVSRSTRNRAPIGPDEALAPAEALALFTGDANDPGGTSRRIENGALADLCLLDRSWEAALGDLAAVEVDATIKDGRVIWQRQ